MLKESVATAKSLTTLSVQHRLVHESAFIVVLFVLLNFGLWA